MKAEHMFFLLFTNKKNIYDKSPFRNKARINFSCTEMHCIELKNSYPIYKFICFGSPQCKRSTFNCCFALQHKSWFVFHNVQCGVQKSSRYA